MSEYAVKMVLKEQDVKNADSLRRLFHTNNNAEVVSISLNFVNFVGRSDAN